MAIRGRGIKSSAQDNFLEPLNVTSLTATDVGTNRPYLATANTTSAASAANTGGAVSLSWTLPASSPAATSYVITTTPSTYTHDTGSSSTSYTFEGLASNTSYTFTVKSKNATGTASGTTSSSVTATTVPNAPSAPSASSSSGSQDVVTWSAPGANGGKSITSYTVVSSDGPSYTNATSPLTINETAGTSQTYRVVAINGNGSSAQSSASNSVTTQPFFPPYFPFFPPYFPFFPPAFPFFPPAFGPFFPPFFPFFPPFFPWFYGFESVAGTTGIMTTDGRKNAEDLVVGDRLIAMNIDGIDRTSMTWLDWSQENLMLNESNLVETTIASITSNTVNKIYLINGDRYSDSHWILTKKDNISKFIRSSELDNTYKVFSYSELGFVDIVSFEILDVEDTIYSIHCEPYDNFFTENMLVFDAFDAVESDTPPPFNS